MPCPTFTVNDLITKASEIRYMQRRFDTIVIANIVIFTALLALKRNQVINVRVRQVMDNAQILQDPITQIKGDEVYGYRYLPLPLEYRRRMQEYLFYLKHSYHNFGPNMHLFPNKLGRKYKEGPLTKHMQAVGLTLGHIRESGICYYFQFLIRNRHHFGRALEETAVFSGNKIREIKDRVNGCHKPQEAGCSMWQVSRCNLSAPLVI